MIGGLPGTGRGNNACTVHVGGILTKTSSLAWCRDFCRRFTQTVRGSRGVIAEERPARKLLLLASLLDVAVLDGGAERGRLQELEERERVRVLYVLAVRRLGPVEQVLEEHHEALVVEVPVHGKVVQVRRVGEAGYELEFERESLLFCGCRDDAWWLSCRCGVLSVSVRVLIVVASRCGFIGTCGIHHGHVAILRGHDSWNGWMQGKNERGG